MKTLGNIALICLILVSFLLAQSTLSARLATDAGTSAAEGRQDNLSHTHAVDAAMSHGVAAAHPFHSVKIPQGKRTENALVVNATGDGRDSNPGDGLCDDGAGQCTLRAAIEEGNASPSKDMVAFDLPGGGPYSIQPAAPLPAVTRPLVIDATTQPGFSGVPLIEIDGSLAGADADGLTIREGRSIVRGLVINRFDGSAIRLGSKGGSLVQGNYIGTDIQGMQALGNRIGILIDDSKENHVGGNKPEERNLISGNRTGILIRQPGAHHNLIQGNLIGVDAQGNPTLPNSDAAVFVVNSGDNQVGGKGQDEGNLVAVGMHDLLAQGKDADKNQLDDNQWAGGRGNRHLKAREPERLALEGVPGKSAATFAEKPRFNLTNNPLTQPFAELTTSAPAALVPVGVTFTVNSTADDPDKSTTDRLCQTSKGVCTLRAAIQQANAIAGADTVLFNISGSGPFVISPRSALPEITSPLIIDATTQPGYTLNTPKVELRGTNAGATTRGLLISAGSSTVRGLAITGFSDAGIELRTNGGNTLTENFVGVNANGTTAQGNRYGIYVSASSNNLIGAAVTGKRNLISGNLGQGIVLASQANSNQIQGNWIGTNRTGEAALGNNLEAISISNANNNLIGGTTPEARNVISGNNDDAVNILSGAGGNLVQGNWIGLKASGTGALANYNDGVYISASSNNWVGGTEPGTGNVISGNSGNGIVITGTLASGNQVQGNIIGASVNGASALPNTLDGIVVDGAPATVIGGTDPGAGNLVSGNRIGIHVYFDTTGALIQGNKIGTNAAGTAILGNTYGVAVDTAVGNTIGGTSPAARNLISGNTYGIYLYSESNGNFIQGNYIGTTSDGTAPLGNTDYGILISLSSNNTVGGLVAEARNIISGNGKVGVVVASTTTDANLIQGNYIGTDVTGMLALPNGLHGIQVQNGPTNTLIGEAAAGAGNVISGNNQYGIRITTSGTDIPTGTQILGNFIGTNPSGVTTLGNHSDGVSINTRGTTIGGQDLTARNVIAYNGQNGILIEDLFGVNTTGNQFSANQIFNNSALGIDILPTGVTANDANDVDTGPNGLQNFPILSSASSTGSATAVSGTLNSASNAAFHLDFYANTACDSSGNGEGEQYLGATDVTTDAGGNASFNAAFPVGLTSDVLITATATDAQHNTSEFSACQPLDTQPTVQSWSTGGSQASAFLGWSVGSVNANGDAYPDLLVGAPYENGKGAVRVFYGTADGYPASANLVIEGAASGDRFGWSVASAGDVNGDGFEDVLVGAVGCTVDQSQPEAGCAYAFYGSPTGLSTTPAWTTAGSKAHAAYGYVVGGAGDVNGDGISDVFVGAPSDGQNQEGKVYVYYGSAAPNAGLSAAANWSHSGQQDNAYFGLAVSAAGDLNGDQVGDLIIGAPNASSDLAGEGKAFIFIGSSNGLAATAAWTAEGDQANAHFGKSVSRAGDINGDGFMDVLVGAPEYDDGSTADTGAVFAYYGSAGDLSTQPGWSERGTQAGMYYGISVSWAGDVDQDTHADILIGAHRFSGGETQEGKVFLRFGAAGGIDPARSWTLEADQPHASLGYAVCRVGAVDGQSTAAILFAAPQMDNEQVDAGRVFLYTGLH